CAFKCGHHGSKHSTAATFLENLSPDAAFISAASHKYCHPDDETIMRLCDEDSSVQKIYLTNCVYNRAGVNDDFEKKEKELKEYAFTQIMKWLEDNSDLIESKPVGFDELLALKPSENEEENEETPEETFAKMLDEEKLEIKSSK